MPILLPLQPVTARNVDLEMINRGGLQKMPQFKMLSRIPILSRTA